MSVWIVIADGRPLGVYEDREVGIRQQQQAWANGIYKEVLLFDAYVVRK